MFADDERKTFKFFNGTDETAVDPMAVYIRMTSSETDLQADFLASKLGDYDALNRLIAMARELFEVPPFGESNGELTGLLDEEVLALLSRFGEYTEDLKERCQPIADVLATYGFFGRPIDFETYFGLWLNRERQVTRDAFKVLQGIGLAFSGDIPEFVWTSVTDSKTQANLAQWYSAERN